MSELGRLLKSTGLAAALLFAASAAPARADCFEYIGCTDRDWFDVYDLVQLSCENLWYVRNRIYDENGYCFGTARGRANFDNSDCWIENQANVKLSRVERHNVNAIVEAERQNYCN